MEVKTKSKISYAEASRQVSQSSAEPSIPRVPISSTVTPPETSKENASCGLSTNTLVAIVVKLMYLIKKDSYYPIKDSRLHHIVKIFNDVGKVEVEVDDIKELIDACCV